MDVDKIEVVDVVTDVTTEDNLVVVDTKVSLQPEQPEVDQGEDFKFEAEDQVN